MDSYVVGVARLPLDPVLAAGAEVGGRRIDRQVLVEYYRACAAVGYGRYGGSSNEEVARGLRTIRAVGRIGAGETGGMDAKALGEDSVCLGCGRDYGFDGANRVHSHERAAGSKEVVEKLVEEKKVEEGRSVVEPVRRVVGGLLRGPNYERNKENREKRKRVKARGKESGIGVGGNAASRRDWRDRSGSADVSLVGSKRAWTRVDGDVEKKLQETRAERLIKENERAVVRARVEAEKLLEYERSGAIQREARARVEVLDGQLSGRYSLVGGGRARGWVETVVSAPSSSSAGSKGKIPSVPSLSSGSVSPNSSISVEESVRLITKNRKLEEELAGAKFFEKEFHECQRQLELLRKNEDVVDFYNDGRY